MEMRGFELLGFAAARGAYAGVPNKRLRKMRSRGHGPSG